MGLHQAMDYDEKHLKVYMTLCIIYKYKPLITDAFPSECMKLTHGIIM